jgi:hypothetical protein
MSSPKPDTSDAPPNSTSKIDALEETRAASQIDALLADIDARDTLDANAPGGPTRNEALDDKFSDELDTSEIRDQLTNIDARDPDERVQLTTSEISDQLTNIDARDQLAAHAYIDNGGGDPQTRREAIQEQLRAVFAARENSARLGQDVSGRSLHRRYPAG